MRAVSALQKRRGRQTNGKQSPLEKEKKRKKKKKKKKKNHQTPTRRKRMRTQSPNICFKNWKHPRQNNRGQKPHVRLKKALQRNAIDIMEVPTKITQNGRRGRPWLGDADVMRAGPHCTSLMVSRSGQKGTRETTGRTIWAWT